VNSGSSTVNSSSRIPVPSTDDVELFCHDTYYDYPASYIYKTDNKLYSTGYNGVGNLGVGDTSARASWTEVDMSMFKNGELPIKIFCNGQNGHNVFGVLTDQGRVYACGYNGYGQLGVGDQSNKTRLTEAICDKFIVDAIFVGHERYMNLHVLTSDGQLLISGCGDNYQLAMPHSTEYPSLAPVAF
jgi:alpha-tubulin suppressor-like RCC1 family protein